MTYSQRGGTLLGFLFGLISGLAVAVVVALYITKAPVPFTGKLGKNEEVAQPGGNKAGATNGDPNQSLYPKNSTPTVSLKTPSVSGTTTSSVEAKPAVDEGNTNTVKDEGMIYFLQAGAFKTPEDAEQMKAKLALLGAEAKISTVDVEGKPLYRVRMGPYRQLDETKPLRKTLSENGVEASVVKQKTKAE